MTDPLDDAIDAAVREMLDVEPRPNLPARVIAQLATSGNMPAVRSPAFGWPLGSLAAAAVILLAVVVARRSDPIPPQAPAIARAGDQHLSAGVGSTMPSSGTAVPPASRRVGGHSASRVPHAPRRAAADAVVAAAFTEDDSATTTIDPLTRIVPISVAPIAQERIAPADLAMPPLNRITDVQIAPLAPPDRRN